MTDIPDRAVSPPGAVPAYERRNWPRRLLRPVLAVVVLLAVLAAGGFVLARHYEGELRRTSLDAPAATGWARLQPDVRRHRAATTC